ncbi:MAG: hypothetical protein C0424_08900 [Sphingobacteriaceae bacterium]|nr:hypothetical protein [Sphingobacteriaceae bacterium]
MRLKYLPETKEKLPAFPAMAVVEPHNGRLVPSDAASQVGCRPPASEAEIARTIPNAAHVEKGRKAQGQVLFQKALFVQK